MLLSSSEFEQLVEEALAGLPERFSTLLENIAVVVEEEPSDVDLDDAYGDEDDGEEELLGIFRGTPLTRRSFNALPELPSEVAVFRGPILRVSRNRREAMHEIRETVIHELGHYFGLGDHEMVF